MSRGRPSREPILTQIVDTDKSRISIGLRTLYKEEKDLLERKLKERGYGSISEWFREKAEEVLLDGDLKQRYEESKLQIKKSKAELEKHQLECDELKGKLEAHETKRKSILKDIGKKLKTFYNRGSMPQQKQNEIAYKVAKKYDLSESKEKAINRILAKAVSDNIKESMGAEEFANRVIEGIKEDRVLEGISWS